MVSTDAEHQAPPVSVLVARQYVGVEHAETWIEGRRGVFWLVTQSRILLSFSQLDIAFYSDLSQQSVFFSFTLRKTLSFENTILYLN